MNQPLYHSSVDLFGETIIQPVPEEVREQLMAAFAEAQAHPPVEDDDCPICRVLRDAGQVDAAGHSATPGDEPRSPNRADRRAMRAIERRASRAARRRSH